MAYTLPPVLTMAQMGKLMGWRTERIREVLRKRNIAFQINPGFGKPWYVTAVNLRASMPEIAIVLEMRAAKGVLDDD